MIAKYVPPGWKLRPAQEKLLEETVAAFDSGKRFVIAEAPPGLGKSLYGVTLARKYKRAYFATLTKQLQFQYLMDFQKHGMEELKGRDAFVCDSCGSTCKIGGVRYKSKPCDPCPYKWAKEKALLAPLTVCNYHSFLYNVKATRPLLVLDEGHAVENVLLEHVGIAIPAGKLPFRVKAPTPHPAAPVEEYFRWLEAFLGEAASVDPEDLTEEAQLELEQLCSKASNAIRMKDREVWIAEPLERKAGFALKPLTVRSFGGKLFEFGERVLLMSATILDAEKLADSLGIPQNEMAFVQAPCPFPVENRQVVTGGLDMRMVAREESWPAMLVQVDAILDGHADEKGLILTASNEMSEYLRTKLDARHVQRFVFASGKTRAEEYARHCESDEPTVLVASGYWEGADLKDDLSRFAIIPAIPRPKWSGQIAARGKLDPRWYKLQGFAKLIQGVGRSVRSETDSALTYCLDGDLRREAGARDSLLPAWFREALITP